jgi:hypothetical protein
VERATTTIRIEMTSAHAENGNARAEKTKNSLVCMPGVDDLEPLALNFRLGTFGTGPEGWLRGPGPDIAVGEWSRVRWCTCKGSLSSLKHRGMNIIRTNEDLHDPEIDRSHSIGSKFWSRLPISCPEHQFPRVQGRNILINVPLHGQ